MKVKSFKELKSLREEINNSRDPEKHCITICGGTGCLAYGAKGLVEQFKTEIEKENLGKKIDIRSTGCHGFCEQGPVVVIYPEKVFYRRVGLDDATEIIHRTVLNGEILDHLPLYRSRALEKKSFMKMTFHFTKSRCGLSLE